MASTYRVRILKLIQQEDFFEVESDSPEAASLSALSQAEAGEGKWEDVVVLHRRGTVSEEGTVVRTFSESGEFALQLGQLLPKR